MCHTTLSPAPLTACFPGSEVMCGGARGSLPGDGHESPRSRVAELPQFHRGAARRRPSPAFQTAGSKVTCHPLPG